MIHRRLTSEAYKNPPTEGEGEDTVLDKKIALKTKKKISAICNIALDNGHHSIVLSAFGCGAYANPPSHVISNNHRNSGFHHRE